MRGRDRFRRFKPLLSVAAIALKPLPKPVLRCLWQWSDALPGFAGNAARYCLLKRLSRRCGDNVMIGPGVEIRYPERLAVGSNVSIHRQCYLDAYGGIEIGDDVSIAHQSSLVSFEHTWSDDSLPIRDNPLVTGAIRIARDVWVGCGCRILSGVDIEGRSVIAAGSVVTRDVPAGTIVGGVPARPIKRIREGGAYERSLGT